MIGSRLLVPIQTRGYFVNKKGHFVKSGLPPLGRRISLTTRLVRRRRLLPRSPAAASCSGLAKSPSPERRDPPLRPCANLGRFWGWWSPLATRMARRAAIYGVWRRRNLRLHQKVHTIIWG
jgi:hypothetical protein